jgi:hypothetical protein
MMHSNPLSAQEIAWRHDYAKARQEAKEKAPPMLLDFGTDQCAWCNKLDAETFQDSKVSGNCQRTTRKMEVIAPLDYFRWMGKRVVSFHNPTVVPL